MPLDVASRHPARIVREDLVVEGREASLMLRDERRLEGAAPVAGDADGDVAVLALERLGGMAVAGGARAAAVGSMLLVAEVVGHLAFEGTLDEASGELVEEAALGEELLRVVAVLEELVEEFFWDRHGW